MSILPLTSSAYGEGYYESYYEGGYYDQSYYQTYYEGGYTAANLVTRFSSNPSGCQIWWPTAGGTCNNGDDNTNPYSTASGGGVNLATRFSLVFRAVAGASSYAVSSDCRSWGWNGGYIHDGWWMFTPYNCVSGATGGSTFSPIDAGTSLTLEFWNRGTQYIGYPNGCVYFCGDGLSYYDVYFLPTCTTNFGASISYNGARYAGTGYGSVTFVPAAGSYSYTVSCTGGSPGTHARTINMTVNAVPAITSFSPTPSTHPSRVNSGSSLGWTTTMASNCTLSGGQWSSPLSVATNGSQATNANLSAYSTTYTLSCSPSLTSQVTVTVDQCTNYAGVQTGTPTNAVLNGDGSCSCQSGFGNPDSNGNCSVLSDLCNDIAGTQNPVPTGCGTSTTPPDCLNEGTQTWDGAQCVASAIPPTGCVSAGNSTCSPEQATRSVRANDTTNIYWSVSGTPTPTCTVSGTNGQNWSGVTGNQTTSQITQRTVYTLACSNTGGSFSDTATINVIPAPSEI